MEGGAIRDWMKDLRCIPRDRIIVTHNPPSERYERAGRQKDGIIQHGRALGFAQVTKEPLAFEVILWTDSIRPGDYGLYTGFKIFYDRKMVPYFARLFCFYDGRDRRSAEIKFKSEASAREYMRSFKTYEELP